MNGELRDRLLLGVGAVVAVAISYTLYTQLRNRTTEAVREGVSRPVDLPARKGPAIPGLEPGKSPQFAPITTGVKLNGPIGPVQKR
ncbi:MAG: hypothetical protein K2X82_10215 [Gemmataceae bacterium]|nr:hypothetical protein [Gemmataceae bacterium]